MFGKQKQKKSLNMEVDLVAFISLLSVCICFLLLASVWIQIGSMHVKQAIGGQSQEGKPKPEMWVVVNPQGAINFELRHTPAKINKSFGNNKIEGVNGKPNLKELVTYVSKLKSEHAELSMALIRPAEKTQFEDIIKMMDVFRESGIDDLGVTPL